jgi:thymidylate synthase
VLSVEFKGINSFIVGISKLLLKSSNKRITRGEVCYELPSPIIVKISNPLSRIVNLPERKWNYTLPFAESLWIAAGRNDISFVGHYLSKMYEFSDDNKFMRAAYGPRLRFHTGVRSDYSIGFPKRREILTDSIIQVDQFRFIERIFKKDPNTRQAIITINDPAKDFFVDNDELKITKDFPCTCTIQFQKVGDKLDLIVHMRSNDFIWGATAVNVFNFTFMQEYFSKILDLRLGNYYHIVNNLHYYERFGEMVKELADKQTAEDDFYEYKKSFNDLDSFDQNIFKLEKYESALRSGETQELIDFDDELFTDWGRIFYRFNVDKNYNSFINPLIANTINRKENDFKIRTS